MRTRSPAPFLGGSLSKDAIPAPLASFGEVSGSAGFESVSCAKGANSRLLALFTAGLASFEGSFQSQIAPCPNPCFTGSMRIAALARFRVLSLKPAASPFDNTSLVGKGPSSKTASK